MGAYTDDLLFIHIPKTAGTAAKEYLADRCPDLKWPRNDYWFSNRRGRENNPNAEDKADAKRTQEEAKLPIGHVPLRHIEHFTGRAPESFERIVAIIRNPYVQQISQWLFWRHRYAIGHTHKHDLHTAGHPRFDTWVGEPFSDFHVWYEQECGIKPTGDIPCAANGYEGWPGFYHYWLSVKPGVIPDNVVILRQEELNAMLPAAVAPYHDGPSGEVEVINTGKTKQDAYFQYINEHSTIKTIEQKFRWTFDNELYPRVEL